MIRRTVAVLFAVVLALTGPSADAKASDPAAEPSQRARATFSTGLRDAESVLASATANLAKALRAGTKTPEAVARDYGAAFVYFAGRVKKLTDEASSTVAAGVSEAIVDASDPSLRGALAGDGGGLDAFVDSMQSSLDAARGRALRSARRFAKTLTAGTSRAQMNVVLPSWTFERWPAPSLPGAVPPASDSIRVLAAVSALLDDGHVVVSIGGRAPPSVSGNFDVRLNASLGSVGVGPLLSAGGVPVPSDGTWSVVATLNDPNAGEAVAPGNRVIAFGVDPYDGGLAGRQPGRLVHGGVIGLP